MSDLGQPQKLNEDDEEYDLCVVCDGKIDEYGHCDCDLDDDEDEDDEDE